MFLIKLVLGIVALPFIILLILLRIFCTILLMVGNLIANILGGIAVLGGGLMLLSGEEGGWATLIVGVVLLALPYIAEFLIEFISGLIEGLKSWIFG